jgi:hypothetical protein
MQTLRVYTPLARPSKALTVHAYSLATPRSQPLILTMIPPTCHSLSLSLEHHFSPPTLTPQTTSRP